MLEIDIEKAKQKAQKMGFSLEETIIIEWLNNRTGDEFELGNIKLADIFENEMIETIKKAKRKENNINIKKIKQRAVDSNISLEEALVFEWLGQRSSETLEEGNIELSNILLDEQSKFFKKGKLR